MATSQQKAITQKTMQEQLVDAFPGRNKQIGQLLGLMGEPTTPVPPAIFINGNSSLGKTAVVKALLSTTLANRSPSRFAFLNCVECHTPRLIFEHAIHQFRNAPPPPPTLLSRPSQRVLIEQSEVQENGEVASIVEGYKADEDASSSNATKITSRPKKRGFPDKEKDLDGEEEENNQPKKQARQGKLNSKVAAATDATSPSIAKNWQRCESVNEFIEWCRKICDTLDDGEHDSELNEGRQQQQIPMLSAGQKETRYLVLDRAERLRDNAPTLLPVLMRLQEMTGRNLCVILISSIVWEKFRSSTGLLEPLVIHFPQYLKVAILARDQPTGSDKQLYMQFVDLVYNVFQHNCKDLNELRHLVALLFPLYIKPIKENKIQSHEILKLHRHIQVYFVEAMDKLYLREISSLEWTDRTHTGGASANHSNTTGSVSLSSSLMDHASNERAMVSAVAVEAHGNFDLPYYTKYILFASFLASYNPARLDMRYFAKVSNQGGKMTKRAKKAAAKKNEGSLGTKLRQQLLGPKPFAIERMLAIFYSIVGQDLEENVNVQVQLASLVSLKLLQRVTPMDKLDSIKCKCNVSYDMIKSIAKSVKFEIDKYLFDFN